MVLRYDEEPGETESSCVAGIDDGVKDRNPGEHETLKRGLLADAWIEKCSDAEADDGVEVHR